MLVVVASYRQNVHAYPSGGGDYEVATVNLGLQRGPDRCLGAAGGLRADRRGVDLLRGRRTPSRSSRSSTGTRPWSPPLWPCCLDGTQPAGRPGVRHLLRHSDLLLHVRHLEHGDLRPVPDPGARRADPGAQRPVRHRAGSAVTPPSPASRWSPCWPAPSPPAALR